MPGTELPPGVQSAGDSSGGQDGAMIYLIWSVQHSLSLNNTAPKKEEKDPTKFHQ